MSLKKRWSRAMPLSGSIRERFKKFDRIFFSYYNALICPRNSFLVANSSLTFFIPEIPKEIGVRK
jgi:hypothetical protein